MDEKIKTLATKAELKAEQDKIATLQMHDLSYFIGNNLGRGGYDGSQNTFVYQPALSMLQLKKVKGIDYVISWKSKGVF